MYGATRNADIIPMCPVNFNHIFFDLSTFELRHSIDIINIVFFGLHLASVGNNEK